MLGSSCSATCLFPLLNALTHASVLCSRFAIGCCSNGCYKFAPCDVQSGEACHWTFDPRTFDPRDQIPRLSVTREFGPGGPNSLGNLIRGDHISRGIGSLSGDLFLLLLRQNFLGNVVRGDIFPGEFHHLSGDSFLLLQGTIFSRKSGPWDHIA